MARHLSWIDNDKLSNLFNRVGSARGRAPAHGRAPVAPPAVSRPPAPAPAVSRPPAPAPAVSPPAPVVAPPAPVVAPPAPVAPAPVAPAPVAPAAAVAPAPVVHAPVAPPVTAYAAEPEPEPTLEPFVPSAGAELYSRMSEFLDWVMSATPLHGVVLADSDGLIIAQRNGSDLEAAMTLGIGPMVQTAGEILFEDPTEKQNVQGHIVFEHHGRQLISLWAPTSQGTCYGVLIGDSVPAGSVLKLVERGLRTVFAD